MRIAEQVILNLEPEEADMIWAICEEYELPKSSEGIKQILMDVASPDPEPEPEPEFEDPRKKIKEWVEKNPQYLDAGISQAKKAFVSWLGKK